MVDWNLRTQVATDNVGRAYERYGTVMRTNSIRAMEATNRTLEAQIRYSAVVESTTEKIVAASYEQFLAMQRLEVAQGELAAAAGLRAKAEADLALIATRAYDTEADRMSLVEAANDRLAVSLGMREIATQNVILADTALARADKAAAAVALEVGDANLIASNKIAIAKEKEALVAEQSAAKQIAASFAIESAMEQQAKVAEEKSLAQIGSMQRSAAAATAMGAGFVIAGTLIAGVLGLAAYHAGTFWSQIVLLHTQARVAESQLKPLATGILNMAGDLGFASTELVKALFLIESVGGGSMTAAHGLEQLKAAAMGAAVGHADLTATADVLASVMAVFPKLLPMQAMGQLDAIVGQGKMTMEDLNNAMKTGILATLHSSGISLADFGGALATMTDYAIPAIQAANSLRMAIYLMTAPTGASDKVLREFGLTTAEVSSVSKTWTDKFADAGIRHAQLAADLRKPGGIIIALQDLRSHLVASGLDAQGQAEVIYKAFGGGKMGKAVLTLYENISGGARASDEELRQLGFTETEIATLHDRLIQKTALINQQTNLLGQNFQYLKSQDPSFMWKEFTASIDVLVISLGQAFIPLLVGFLRAMIPIVNTISLWIREHEGLVRVIGGTVIAFSLIFGTAMMVIGALAGIALGIAAISYVGLPLLGGISALFLGLAAAGAAFSVVTMWLASNWRFFADLWDTRVVPAGSRIVNTLGSIWTIITSGLSIVRPMFDSAFNSFGEKLTENGSLWDEATLAFQGFSTGLLAFVKSPTFASLVASFAVTLPSAIGVSLDLVLLFLDTVQAAFVILVGSVRISSALIGGHLDQAKNIAASTMEELLSIQNRYGEHANKLAKDISNQLDGTNQDMWQQVYDNTMAMTQRLNDDGTIRMVAAGKNMADGLIGGIAERKEALRTEVASLVALAAATTKDASVAYTYPTPKPATTPKPGPATTGVGARRFYAPQDQIKDVEPQILKAPEVSGWTQTMTEIGGFIGGVKDKFSDLQAHTDRVWRAVMSRPMFFVGLGLTIVGGAMQQMTSTVAGILLIAQAGIGRWTLNTIQRFIQLGKDIAGQAGRLKDAVVGWIENAIREAPGMWSRFSNTVGQGIIDTFWTVNREGKIGWERFTNWLKTEWEKIPSEAETLGRQIAEGIWNGMNLAYGGFTKHISDFFDGIITGAQRKLGIASPSVLFARETGQPITQGIWMGINQERPILMRNFNTMLVQLSDIAEERFPSSRTMMAVALPPRIEPTQTASPSESKREINHNTTVKTETKVNLLLDGDVLSTAIDERTYDILQKGYNVN